MTNSDEITDISDLVRFRCLSRRLPGADGLIYGLDHAPGASPGLRMGRRPTNVVVTSCDLRSGVFSLTFTRLVGERCTPWAPPLRVVHTSQKNTLVAVIKHEASPLPLDCSVTGAGGLVALAPCSGWARCRCAIRRQPRSRASVCLSTHSIFGFSTPSAVARRTTMDSEAARRQRLATLRPACARLCARHRRSSDTCSQLG